MGEQKDNSDQGAVVSSASNPKSDDKSSGDKNDSGKSEVKDLRDDALSPHFCKLLGASGFPSQKRYNLLLLEHNVVAFISGNTVQIMNLDSMSKKILYGTDTGGVGAIAANVERSFLAVAEKGLSPKILIYSYPELEVAKTLEKGTTSAYSSINFSPSGDRLASVGNYPDYLLTVWDWHNEQIMLRCKAFSQEVFRVEFSPTVEGRLITSGTGHIRFWKMASTFTGLKLQGDIGKFGHVDITDVSAFVELEGGRVLSSSESGNLLAWEGEFVQFEICRPDGSPCHEGAIEALHLDGNTLTTGGRDGFLRQWDVTGMDYVETADGDTKIRLEPKNEVKVGEHSQIKYMLKLASPKSGDSSKSQASQDETNVAWLIQDSSGELKRVVMSPFSTETLMSFHRGAINGLAMSPRGSYLAISGGSGGSVRCMDVRRQRHIYSEKFGYDDLLKRGPSGGETALAEAIVVLWIPESVVGDLTAVAVGFSDGVFRVLQRCADCFVLIDVLKPHCEAIRFVAYSPDGTCLATCSDDKTVFFFQIQSAGEYTPIGFVSFESAPRSPCWDESSSYLLVACGAEVIEVKRPTPGTHDVTKTFELSGIPRQSFTLEPPAFIEGVSIPSASNEDDESAQSPAGEPGNGEAISKPQKVCAVSYSHGRNFYMCTAGRWSSVLFECGFNGQGFIRAIQMTTKGEVSFLGLNLSRRILLIGATDGTVEMRKKSALERFFVTNCHDGGTHGSPTSVTNVSLSFDEQFLVSVDSDGNMFTHRCNMSKAIELATTQVEEVTDECAAQNMLLPSAPSTETLSESRAVPPAADITDADTYSIQQDKLQREKDLELAASDRRRAAMLEEIDALRQRFMELVARNAQLDPIAKLPRSEFEIDATLRERLLKAREEKIARAQAEMAWVSEKRGLELEKLRDKFLTPILVEHFTLKAFRRDVAVSSLRTAEIPEKTRREIEEIHALVNMEIAERQEARRQENQQKQAKVKKKKHLVKTGHGGGIGGRRGSSKSEIARAARKKKYEEARGKLDSDKPDEHADDPRDVQAMEYARANMGDYKLKSDPNYIVPEKQRITAEQKRRQMLLLEESVHCIKMKLNDRVLALRDLKQRIVESIASDNVRLMEINVELGIQDHLFEPALDPAEFPDRRDVCTQEDLVAYEAKLEYDKTRAKKTKHASAFGGGDDEDDNEDSRPTSASKTTSDHGSSSYPTSSQTVTAPGAGTTGANQYDNDARSRASEDSMVYSRTTAGLSYSSERSERMIQLQARMDSLPMSDIQQLKQRRRLAHLRNERQIMLDKINNTVETFDQAIADLRQERLKLDADLKTTDLRLLTLHEELKVLQKFKDRELELQTKVQTCRREKAQVVVELTDIQEKLAVKLEQIQAWQQKDREIMEEFDTIVGGDKSEIYTALMKIFKRKMKRSKKPTNDEAENSDDEDESESESEEDFSDEDSDASVQEDDVCPKDCEPAVFEKVLDLREKRLDQEELLLEFNKSVEEYKNQYQAHTAKEKVIDRSLGAAEEAIQRFQTEKQRALNEVEVLVPLRLSQIHCINAGEEGAGTPGQLGSDLSNALLFEKPVLERLRYRVGELHCEKLSLRKELKELKRRSKILAKELKMKQAQIEVEKKKCEEVQLLKFGQLIDMDLLDQASTNHAGDKLRDKLTRMEKAGLRKIAKVDQEIHQLTDELAKSTAENTRLLQQVAELTQRKTNLEDQLNAACKNVRVGDSDYAERKHATEMHQLIELARDQAGEIDALKTEIHLLTRKGGHLFGVTTAAKTGSVAESTAQRQATAGEVADMRDVDTSGEAGAPQ